MNIGIAVFSGVIQGLTEFLPVSSSGHLVLVQKISGISEPTLFFSVMLHAGTLLAVFVVLWRDIWAVLRRPIQPLTGYLILATLPIVAAALVLRNPIERAFETGMFLGFSFLTTSALLFSAELLIRRRGTNLKKPGEMNWRDALTVGIMQAVAIIPGVSRSGATITGALSRGLDRDFAARFSFLLCIPAILGALVLHLKELADGGMAEAANGGITAAEIIAGSGAAAVTGFFAVKFMLKIIREKSLFGFAAYTAVLGTLVLVDQFVTRIIF